MSKCANNKCNKNPLNQLDRIVVSQDGDFVCNKSCEAQYMAQKDEFFGVLVHDREALHAWLQGSSDG